ncbi:MAG: hypothetical protein OEM27_08095, partial [Nitrospinota bacterium]|nr:hypothetical protein [Nitrospinota bacterium]
RLWITEVAQGDVDLEKLTDVQLKSGEGVYSEPMAAYVQWLAPRIDELKKTLPEEKIKLRAMARHKKFNHDRTPDMLASLLPGLQYFLKFAVDSGAIDQDRAEELEYAGWRHMGEAADRQGAHQQAEDPARRFMDLVSGALASGTAHVVDADLGDQPLNSPESWGWRPFLSEDSNMHYQPKGQKIGWVDTKDNLYLEPNTTFALVQRIGNDQGAPISVSQQTLWKRLSEKGWILKENQKGHHTIRRKIEGHRRRVVQLIFKLPPVSEAVQAVPDGPQENNANENNEVGTASVDRFSENGQKGGPQNGPQPQQNQQPGPDGPDGPPVEQGVQENFNEGEL